MAYTGGINDVNFQNTLKKVYETKEQKILKERSHPLHTYIGQNSKKVTGGQDHNYLAEIGTGGGVGARPNERLDTGVKVSSGINAKLNFTVVNQLGQFKIETKATSLTKTNTEAFLSHFDRQMSYHMDGTMLGYARQTAGTKTGELVNLAQVIHAFDAGAKTITLKVLDQDRIEVGQEIELYDFVGDAYLANSNVARPKVIATSPTKDGNGHYDVIIIGQDADLTAALDTTLLAQAAVIEYDGLNVGMNGIEDFILKDSNTIGGVDKSLAQNY
jgi:hypothetical protein